MKISYFITTLIYLSSCKTYQGKTTREIPNELGYKTNYYKTSEYIFNITCDTCQTIGTVIYHSIDQNLKRYDKPKKGAMEIAILEEIDSKQVCTYKSLKSYEAKSDYKLRDLIKECSKMLITNKDFFEDTFSNYFNESIGILQKLCIPKYCNALWPNGKIESSHKFKRENNIKRSYEFMEWNMHEEDVITMDSGLQYKVLKKSQRNRYKNSPKSGDLVKLFYKGERLDGSVFDSNYGEEPIAFSMNTVLKSWQEILSIMKEGDEYQFFVPPHLGYEEFSFGHLIEPYEVLVFYLTLLEIL